MNLRLKYIHFINGITAKLLQRSTRLINSKSAACSNEEARFPDDPKGTILLSFPQHSVQPKNIILLNSAQSQ